MTLTQEQTTNLALIAAKLQQLGCFATPRPDVTVGPVVTAYRFNPLGSTKFSHLEALANDIAITLGVEDVYVKRLPGENCVAFFVPNKSRQMISFIDSVGYVWAKLRNNTFDDGYLRKLPINLGVDYMGKPLVPDLVQQPHLLIAGSTGSGKSTLVSSILATLIYTVPSSDLQLILSDTKNVEFGHFVGAPHLMFEPAKSVSRTIEHMDYLVSEIEDRLKTLAAKKVRNIFEYQLLDLPKMPYIVLVIDELADLLTDKTKESDDGKGPTNAKKAEELLSKIVQKSRAAGVYVIAGTQRPSVNIVSGSVKANFPSRLTFRLPSGPDSRTVLGTEGAEHLLSQGDFLWLNPNSTAIIRGHSPYASISDINAAVEAAIRQEISK